MASTLKMKAEMSSLAEGGSEGSTNGVTSNLPAKMLAGVMLNERAGVGGV